MMAMMLVGSLAWLAAVVVAARVAAATAVRHRGRGDLLALSIEHKVMGARRRACTML